MDCSLPRFSVHGIFQARVLEWGAITFSVSRIKRQINRICLSFFMSEVKMGFLGGSDGKESSCNVGDPGSTPGLGRSPGEGIDYPLQYCWASHVVQLERIHLQCGRPGFDPWIGKNPLRRERLPIPFSWSREFHGL